MAVAIIRQLTLAQVEAAISAGSTSWNNNYAGTQVYVTDKDWHLACYLDRIAKPLSGVLKINNGDTLPAWLTPERIEVDFGTITSNIDGSEGNPGITIALAATYYPVLLITKNLDAEAEIGPVYVMNDLGQSVLRFPVAFFQNEQGISHGAYLADSLDGTTIKHPYVLFAAANSGSGIQVKVVMELLPAF